MLRDCDMNNWLLLVLHNRTHFYFDIHFMRELCVRQHIILLLFTLNDFRLILFFQNWVNEWVSDILSFQHTSHSNQKVQRSFSEFHGFATVVVFIVLFNFQLPIVIVNEIIAEETWEWLEFLRNYTIHSALCVFVKFEICAWASAHLCLIILSLHRFFKATIDPADPPYSLGKSSLSI